MVQQIATKSVKVIFNGVMKEECLPTQLIDQGKTKACQPEVNSKFPDSKFSGKCGEHMHNFL